MEILTTAAIEAMRATSERPHTSTEIEAAFGPMRTFLEGGIGSRSGAEVQMMVIGLLDFAGQILDLDPFSVSAISRLLPTPEKKDERTFMLSIPKAKVTPEFLERLKEFAKEVNG